MICACAGMWCTDMCIRTEMCIDMFDVGKLVDGLVGGGTVCVQATGAGMPTRYTCTDRRSHARMNRGNSLGGISAQSQHRTRDRDEGWRRRGRGRRGLAQHSTIKEMDLPHCLDVSRHRTVCSGGLFEVEVDPEKHFWTVFFPDDRLQIERPIPWGTSQGRGVG